MVCALRDDSRSSSQDLDSHEISLAQRTPARLIEDHPEVHNPVRESGQFAVKRNCTRASNCHIH